MQNMDWQQEPQTNTVSQIHKKLRGRRFAFDWIPAAGVFPLELAF